MFTHTEADNYNEKGSTIYQDMQSIFRKTVSNGGWSMKSPQDFTAAEIAWVNAFEQIAPWLVRTFRDNIYEVNLEAGKIWKKYIESRPRLFKEVGFCKNILRIYADPFALDAAINLNRQLGGIIQTASSEDLLNAYPGFQFAAESHNLSGSITVEGFTVNIHPFVAKLIDRITALGGEFLWNCEVQGIRRNFLGEVIMLESQLGPLEADHFVVSPGVTGNGLLSGTACENLVHGVLGVWLQIPNLHPQMQHSIKIHRRAHLVEDVNVTVAKDTETGEDILIFGGGYGYVGLHRPPPDNPELMTLFDELEEVARIYFPRGYAVAKERGTLWPGGNRKFCVRPFTPTGLGLFERVPTASGAQPIITGGNDTGGFAQSPAVARAVWRALVGEHDPIHVLFHPHRGKLPTAETHESEIPRPLSLRSIEARQPLRLLLLCSDGPSTPTYDTVLTRPSPATAASWKHTMGSLRRQIFGHDRQRRAYFNRLVSQDHVSPTPDLTVDSLNCREVWEAVEQWQPQSTIVSGTEVIGRKLIARSELMINLHIGHLPEYKGNHCIFFALYDGAVDKVSATLHQLSPHLDGGDILERVFPTILPVDNEETLYVRCMHMAVNRCIKHIEQFSLGGGWTSFHRKLRGGRFGTGTARPGRSCGCGGS